MSTITAPLPRPGSLRAWILAARPPTLTVAFAPVLVGTAVAHARGGARVGPALAALGCALLIQVATNLANDVFDHEKGADTAERLGPTRAVAAGLLSPRDVKRGMWVVLALALALGSYLVWLGGPLILAVGLASILSGLAYTGGPFPLAYNGLGDVFVLAFFGVVAVVGTSFLQLGRVEPLALLASLPVGALATAVLVVNNVRDRETDARAGKHTLAVRLGRRFAVGEYLALLAASYAIPLYLAVESGRAERALPLATLPLAILTARVLVSGEGRALNACLGATARLCLAHAALFSSGLALRPG